MALIDGLGAIGDAIREKNGTTELIPFADMPQAIRDISSGGGTEELETLIDESGVLEDTEGSVSEKVEQLIDLAQWEEVLYRVTENVPSAISFFSEMGLTKAPRTNFIKASSVNYCFRGNNFESIDYYINSKACYSGMGVFSACPNLKRIMGINTSLVKNCTDLFNRCIRLEEITEPFDFTNATTTSKAFELCPALKDVSFVEGSIKVSIAFPQSSLLSAESIQSIIDGLATVETAQTLTLNSAIVLTDEQKATINAKGWTLVQ